VDQGPHRAILGHKRNTGRAIGRPLLNDGIVRTNTHFPRL